MIKEEYMRRAIELAKRATGFTNPNPLVGVVIVKEDRIIGEGYHEKCGQLHAERNAFASLKESAEGATLYVTLEPCQMCAGAIVQARVKEVVIGAMNPKAGCAGSILNLFTMKQFNHQVQTTYGVCEAECSQILKQFFAGLRKRLHETDGSGICNRK